MGAEMDDEIEKLQSEVGRSTKREEQHQWPMANQGSLRNASRPTPTPMDQVLKQARDFREDMKNLTSDCR